MEKFSHDPRALTERCRDPHAFLNAFREGGAPALARHLADCPACLKVVTDTLKALVSEGHPLEPPAALKAEARRILEPERPDRDLERIIIITKRADGSLDVVGAIAEPVGKGPAVRFPLGAGPYAITAEIEPIEDRFLLRISSREPADAVAVLRGNDGETILPPRRLEAALAWSALTCSNYKLSIAGSAGSGVISLRFGKGA